MCILVWNFRSIIFIIPINKYKFYFTIRLIDVHIKHYLWGRAEFKSAINPSQLTFMHPLSSFHHHHHPPHLYSPATTPNNPAASPSPLLRNVGLTINPTAPSQGSSVGI